MFIYIIFTCLLHYYNSTNYYYWIFSEIDEPLDFNETLIDGSVLNVVSVNNMSFLQKSLFKKLSAFKVISFV